MNNLQSVCTYNFICHFLVFVDGGRRLENNLLQLNEAHEPNNVEHFTKLCNFCARSITTSQETTLNLWI